MIEDALSVAAYQMDLTWHRVERNVQKVIDQAKDQNDIDLLILPEMFTTGFTMHPASVAEEMKGQTITQLVDIAYKKDMAIMGSIVIKEHEKYFNRMILIQSDGQIDIYDKRHLFSIAGEDKVYQKGSARPIWDIKGWRICPQICYDLRFPVWSMNTSDYDLLVYVANWPSPRHQAWSTLLEARAIENQSYVVGVNRVGIDNNGWNFSGGSKLVNYMGSVIEEADASESIIHAELDKRSMEVFRDKYPFLSDNDRFTIEDQY